MTVGADAYIGPSGSYEFAVDFHKIGAFCRVDVGIDPYIRMRRCLRIRRGFLQKNRRCGMQRLSGVLLQN